MENTPMKKPTIESLTEELERMSKSETTERQRRYALETEKSHLEKQIKNFQEQLRQAERSADEWRAQLSRAQGHLTGMRETLLALGVVKNPEVKVIPQVAPYRQEQTFPSKLWPEFE
jgi:septal ring factor EnvC (AmiA/AmiB activator)